MRSDRSQLKVCERVYRVGGPEISDGRDCCVYLVDGAGPLALIDCGCGPGYKNILANIIRLGFEPERLEWILLTHCHIDHVGAAALFKTDYGVDLIAHTLDSAPLESGDRLMTAAFMYQMRFDPLKLDRKLIDEEEELLLGDLKIKTLLTPGHTPGSICAYFDINSTKVLFGQDIHGPFHPDFGSDIAAWRLSMARLLELNADILCEGHFGVYSPSSAVRAYIEGYLDQFAR
jgi:glyoxylase-like metal-dependent hydrolase (beta-lactamase superfamily II)